MKVNNLSVNNSIKGTDAPLELKDGETYTVIIKETLPDDEAIVQIRGKDVQVKFEGGVPQGDRVQIQITDTNDDLPHVKVTGDIPKSEQIQIDPDISKLLKSLGITPTQDLKSAINLVISFSLPVDKKIVEILKSYVNNINGTDVQKLDALKALLNKKLDLSLPNLIAVYSALNSRPIANILDRIMANSYEQKEFSRLDNLFKDSRIESSASMINVIATQESTNFHRDTISNVGGEVESTDYTEYVQNLKDDSPIEQNMKEKLRERANDPNAIQADADQESNAIEENRIRSIKNSVQKSMDEVINIIQNLQEYEGNDYLQSLINLPSKEYIVAEVTGKLSEISEQFKNIQKEVTRNIDNLLLHAQISRRDLLPQIKPILENTIDLIDKAILKSEITLFTDMKTEKVLLQASSQLAEARRILGKGNFTGAQEILENVKDMIRKIEFQPTDVKVRHFISKEIFSTNPGSEVDKLSFQFERFISQQQNIGSSAKNAFEMIRSLGINYDSDIAQALTVNTSTAVQEEIQRNMKATLLNLLKGETEQRSQFLLHKDVEQVVNHITGQQLLSKTDNGTNLQTMFFSLPLVLGKQIENLNVYINSKKDGEKIDWENCSIYFLIDTKKMGETGILLNSSDRNLSITLKNDQLIFKEKMEPLVSKYKEKLKEIGFNITGINFTKLNPEPTLKDHKIDNKPNSVDSSVVPSKKGFDYKI